MKYWVQKLLVVIPVILALAGAPVRAADPPAQASFEEAFEKNAALPPLPTAALPAQTPGATLMPQPSASLCLDVPQTPGATPMPQPSVCPYIPDIEGAQDGETANSNRTLYEDAYNLYYLNEYYQCARRSLYCISKEEMTTRLLSRDCGCFTLCDGVIYYAEREEAARFYNTIKSFDPSSGKGAVVRTLEYNVGAIAGYGGRLYFTYETEYLEQSDLTMTDLYSMKTNGSRFGKVADDVYSFAICGDIIYFTRPSKPGGGPFYTSSLNGSGAVQLREWAGRHFEVGSGAIFYQDGFQAIGSPSFTAMDYNDFTVAGQYLVYDDCAQSSKGADIKVSLYDWNAGVAYADALTLEGIGVYTAVRLHAAGGGVCLSAARDDGCFDIYRIIIQNGQAAFEPAGCLD